MTPEHNDTCWGPPHFATDVLSYSIPFLSTSASEKPSIVHSTASFEAPQRFFVHYYADLCLLKQLVSKMSQWFSPLGIHSLCNPSHVTNRVWWKGCCVTSKAWDERYLRLLLHVLLITYSGESHPPCHGVGSKPTGRSAQWGTEASSLDPIPSTCNISEPCWNWILQLWENLLMSADLVHSLTSTSRETSSQNHQVTSKFLTHRNCV